MIDKSNLSSALIASISLSAPRPFSCFGFSNISCFSATSRTFMPQPSARARSNNYDKLFSPTKKNQRVRFSLYQARENSSLPERVTLELIAEQIKSGDINRLLVVAGAGVSCSAGIPDFRTPGSGLYDNLHKFNLPYPEAIFDLNFYQQDPQPFVTLAKEIWPGVKYMPTLTHCFLSLLDKKGLLLRVYTQNIDGLEEVAGVNPDRLVECHGHFRSASCSKCRSHFDSDECKSIMLEEGKAPICKVCGSFVKPDIVFFGEELPSLFSDLVYKDVDSCDLLLVMGTSLLVAPVAYIPEWVSKSTPRLLMNRELVGDFRRGKLTDICMEGDCDDRQVSFSFRVSYDVLLNLLTSRESTLTLT